MAGYHWTQEELFQKLKSKEKSPDVKEMPEIHQKWIFLNRNKFSTVNCANNDEPKGFPLHVHKDHDEIIFYLDVREGQGQQVEDKIYKVKKGDIIVVPAGTPHTGRMAVTALSIYTPAFDPDNPDRHPVE